MFDGELRFDPVSHKYHIGDRELPSVTGVMKTARLFDYGEFALAAADRGTEVHTLTELADSGALTRENIPNPLTGYVDGWERFKKETRVIVLAVEEPVVNRIYGYAGKLDRRVTLAGRESIIDIKTGLSAPWHGAQTTAYARCFSNWPDLSRFCLYIDGDGSYKLEEHKDPRDWDLFRACLTIYAWKARNGLLRRWGTA